MILDYCISRLGSMWKGVEPIRGEYNETYLKVMGEIVASAESYGIYTILDMHQDDFSEKVTMTYETNYPYLISNCQ